MISTVQNRQFRDDIEPLLPAPGSAPDRCLVDVINREEQDASLRRVS
jgi:hypothetical protein